MKIKYQIENEIGSFAAVSTPIFATKAAFFSIFQAPHFFLCTIPDFCDFSSLCTIFCKILAKFLQNFKQDSRFCKFSSNFNGFCPEFRRISAIFRKKPEKEKKAEYSAFFSLKFRVLGFFSAAFSEKSRDSVHP